jgi:hypothetical protein
MQFEGHLFYFKEIVSFLGTSVILKRGLFLDALAFFGNFLCAPQLWHSKNGRFVNRIKRRNLATRRGMSLPESYALR